MSEELKDIQDKINYLEWQLKNKLEEAIELKKRVDKLYLTKRHLRARLNVDHEPITEEYCSKLNDYLRDR